MMVKTIFVDINFTIYFKLMVNYYQKMMMMMMIQMIHLNLRLLKFVFFSYEKIY
jgi:hypothetical protein